MPQGEPAYHILVHLRPTCKRFFGQTSIDTQGIFFQKLSGLEKVKLEKGFTPFCNIYPSFFGVCEPQKWWGFTYHPFHGHVSKRLPGPPQIPTDRLPNTRTRGQSSPVLFGVSICSPPCPKSQKTLGIFFCNQNLGAI